MAVSNVRKRFIIGLMTDHLSQKSIESKILFIDGYNDKVHGLQTPNEGLNQRYLKNCADVADKICFGRT